MARKMDICRLLFLSLAVWCIDGAVISSLRQPRLSLAEEDPGYYFRSYDGNTNTYMFGYDSNNQFRNEERLPNGTVVGSYGYIDPNGMPHRYNYIADEKGYRVRKDRSGQNQQSNMNQSQNQQNNMNQNQYPSNNLNQNQYPPDNMNLIQNQPNNMNQNQNQQNYVNQNQYQPNNINQNQYQPNNMNQNQYQPNNMNQNQYQPNNMNQNQYQPNNMNQNQYQPNNMNQNQYQPNNMNQNQYQPNNMAQSQNQQLNMNQNQNAQTYPQAAPEDSITWSRPKKLKNKNYNQNRYIRRKTFKRRLSRQNEDKSTNNYVPMLRNYLR